ncbi:MAG: hypothetical protein C0467_32625 [Planctomycetaceae bacterium]|nr:hypothetical protein [Planctomycetaceae bacterium]
MMLCTRVEARDFRALFARCLAGRPRGPAPPVVVRFREGTRAVASTTTDGVTLTHTATAEEGDEWVVLPGSVLGDVSGNTDEGVRLDRQSKLRGVLHVPGGRTPQTLAVGLIIPGKQHERPATPDLLPVTPKFLVALHECGCTTAREPGRFALTRVQIQGRAGRVVATDGKAALLCEGFTFPFAEDVLVPAVPVFGSKPLIPIRDARVGRTETHLVVAVGPWAVWLPVDARGRYPDVAALISRQPTTVVEVDPGDAAELINVLPGLPSHRDENRPITIDAADAVTIRGRGESVDNTQEVILARSRVHGPAFHVALDRRLLTRALALGCHAWKLTPGKPFSAEGAGVTLVAAPLDPTLIVPPRIDAMKCPTETPVTPAEHPAPITQRRSDMPPSDTNGHTPSRGDPPDPLLVAEELREALAGAAVTAARLVTILKVGRKEKKVLSSILANLRQLGLDAGGPQQ